MAWYHASVCEKVASTSKTTPRKGCLRCRTTWPRCYFARVANMGHSLHERDMAPVWRKSPGKALVSTRNNPYHDTRQSSPMRGLAAQLGVAVPRALELR